MANVNKVILIGNITRDIELRYTPKGTAVVDLGLAMNRVRLDDAGNKIEETTFVDVTLWGRQAELANQYLAKGRQVYIEGRLQLDSWQDKSTGQNRNKLRVIGEVMQFLGGGQAGGGNSSGGGSYQATNTAQPQQAQAAQPQQRPTGGTPTSQGNMAEEDDIPF